MAAGDVVTVELVYESPPGCWTAMTTHVAFGGFPDAFHALLEAYRAAFETGLSLSRPGTRQGEIADAADATIAGLRYRVGGKPRPDRPGIGLDGGDGPGAIGDPGFPVIESMVLSLRPGAQTSGGEALLVGDAVLVRPEGGVRLAPHDAQRRLVVLPLR